MHNKAFWKAIHLLSRPVSLGAVALLLVNDQLLRQFWPSWATGKIGDFAWLFFFPFALAALLAALVPPRLPRQEKIVGWLAFGLTGGIFALAQTLPGFHTWLAQGAEALLGTPFAITRDPTDLVALISLGASWQLWKHQTVSTLSFNIPGWVALPLAALLTVANSAAPNYGIDCLMVQDDQILAHSVYESYSSQDGGLSWLETENSRSHTSCPDTMSWKAEWSPPDEQRLPDMASTSQAERAYIEKTRGGNIYYRPGPLDVETDPRTQNTIYAMGHEGVLVNTADDEWAWVPVGNYRRVEFDQAGAIFSLLNGEGMFAVGFGLLCASTWATWLFHSRLRAILLVVAWGVWGLGLLVFPPALTTGYAADLIYPFLLLALLFILGLTLYAVHQIYRRSLGVLVRVAIAAIVAGFLFFIPYVLWMFDSLPSYTAATLFAFAAGGLVLLLGIRWARARDPLILANRE